MDRGVFKAILLSIVLLALVVLTIAIVSPFLGSLRGGAVLVTATHPIHQALCRKLGDRPTLAAGLMTAAVVLGLILPFALMAPRFVVEGREFFTEGWVEIRDVVRTQVKQEGTIPNRVDAWLTENFREEISLDQLRGPSRMAITLARDTATAILATIAGVFFMVIALFYFYRDGEHAVQVVRELLPLDEDDRNLVIGALRDAVNASVRGGLLTALVQGALGAAILAILDVRGPVFWGAVIALASLIPLVGTAIVWGPIALFLLWQDEPWKAFVLALYGAIVIGTADNVLRPIFVGKQMKAHSMLLFFGILGAIMLFGFKGIVLGPVVVACVTATMTLFRREFAGRT
ncbi:MAG: AI-2E family transporter [Planctomycetota bacterium]